MLATNSTMWKLVDILWQHHCPLSPPSEMKPEEQAQKFHIPYWRCNTTQVRLVPLIGWSN